MDLNEYDQFLSGASKPAASASDEYSQFIDGAKDESLGDLKRSMLVASQSEPDQKAKVLELSRKTRLPPNIVERNFDRLQKKASLDHDYDSMLENTPKFAAWMKDPNNAAVGRDDIDNLGKLERHVNDHSFLKSFGNWLGAGFSQMNADLSKIPALAYDVAAYPQNKINEMLGRDVRVTSDQTFFGRENPLTQHFVNANKEFVEQSPEISASITALTAKGDYAAAGKALLAQTVANAPQQVLLLASAMAGFPEEGLALAGATSAANKNAQNLQQGIDPTKGVPDALATGSLESGFESVGTLGYLKSWEHALEKQFGKQISKEVVKAYAKTLAQNVMGEATEEALTSAAQDITDYVTGVNTNPDFLKGIPERALNAGLIGGFSGGLITAPTAATGHVFSVAQQRIQTQQAKDFYLAFGKSAEATKLRERLPEAQKNLIEQITKDSPVENIYLSPEAIEKYAQSANINPVAAVQSMGLSQEYDSAKEAGLDLRIPLSTWADKVVGTDHYGPLADDIKFSPEQMSVNELKEANERQAKIQKDVEEQANAADNSVKKIETNIREKLKTAGLSSQEVKHNSALYSEFFGNLGNRLGVDPFELYQRYGLQVSRDEAASTVGLNQGSGPIDHAKAIEETFGAPDALDRYAQMEGSTGGRDIDPDLMRSLYEPYAASREGAIQHLELTGEPLSGLANKAFTARLEQEPGAPVVFMAGGSASGKTLYRTLFNEQHEGLPLVYDTTLSNYKLAKERIEESLAAGHPVQINFVYSPFDQAIEGNKERFRESGRLVDPHTLARTHAGAIDTVLRLMSDYEGDSRVQVDLFQRNGGNLISSPIENLAKLRYNQEGQSLRSATRALEKRAKEALKNETDEVRATKERLAQEAGDVGRVVGANSGGGGGSQGRGSVDNVFEDQAKSSEVKEFKQHDAGDIRGQIRFGPDRQFKIDLFKSADLSTFLHESGHFFLEVMHDLAQDENAPQQIKDDLSTIREWVGAKEGEPLTVDQHEQFARGFEAYLMEGRAPSSKLREAFNRFRIWLVGVYRQIKNLNVGLTPEIRSVFDRMLAADDEVESAQTRLDAPILFNDPIRMGMSEKKAYEYMNAAAFAEQEAKDELTQKVMAQEQRKQTKEWKSRRDQIKQEVLAEANKKPVYIALSIMQKGKMPDGSELPGGMSPVKLSRQSLVERFGEQILKTLPRPYIYAKSGGVNIGTASEMFGYKSGEEFIDDILRAGTKDDYVNSVTDQRMKDEHGDLLTDGSLPKEAMDAIHNGKRAQLLRRELEILASNDLSTFKEVIRRVSRPIPNIEEVKHQAQEMIGKMVVRDIRPIAYERAQSRLAKQAVDLMLKGDLDGAFEAKYKELLNHELYKAATDAREQAEKTIKYMRKFRKKSKREQLGRADYLEQIDSILNRFEFARVPQKELDQREKNLSEWIKSKMEDGESMGEDIYTPDILKNETIKKNYKYLTHDELTGIRDTVRQLEHMAIQTDKNLATKKRVRREDIKAQLISSLVANVKKRPPRPFTDFGENAIERSGKVLGGWDIALLKLEQIFDWMDGGDIEGPWQTYLWHTSSDAQAAEYDYSAKITAKIAEHVIGMPKELRGKMADEISIPGIERRLVRRDLIGVALNVGNESNYQKLLAGQGWSESQVRTMLDHLTKEEWGFVQGVWDTLESMWPDISALQKELTGIEPDKVKIRPVITKHGAFKGGYYPLMYDHIASTQGEMQMSQRVGGLVENTYVRATTPKGHTKTRIEDFSAPINLDVDSLPGHIAGVIKDLTHRKWLMDANWIANDRDIRAAIADHMGPEYVTRLNEWVKQVANDRNYASLKSVAAVQKTIEHFRYNAVIAALGFKATVMISQIAGAGNSVEVIGGQDVDGRKWMLRGIGKTLQHPMEIYKEVTEKSGEMRHRFETRDREIRDKLRTLSGREDAMAKVQELAMNGIGLAEMMVSLPTWMGAYEKAIFNGQSEETAIRAGDRAVRLSQGASGAKDLSAVMAKNNELMKLLTMFYTPFSALYSRLRDVGHSFAENKNVPELLIRTFWVWTLPAVYAAVGSGQGPDEDKDETWLGWLSKTILMYPFQTLPLIRDAANYIAGDYGYTFSPVESALKAAVRPGKTAAKYVEGDKDLEDLAVDTFKASGYWLGLPTGQLSITGSYLKDVLDGEESPDNLGQFAKNMMMRRKHH